MRFLKFSKQTIVFLLAVFSVLKASAQLQTNKVGGVSISNDTLAPHPSAMLDIRSHNKGILIPRMTFAERNAMSSDPTKMTDGLMVYVTDSNTNQAFWFGSANSTPQGWRKIRNFKPAYPDGAIIMYCGSFSEFDANGAGIVGTEKEGWVICDGRNGAPDLRGKFVVGADKRLTDYDEIGNTGGKDTIMFAKDNLYKHTHKTPGNKATGVVPYHTHKVNDPKHSHTYEHDWGMNGGRVDNGGNDDTPYTTKNATTGLEVIKDGPKTIIPTIPNDFISNVGERAPFENRPQYYIVAYIMKRDGKSFISKVPAPEWK